MAVQPENFLNDFQKFMNESLGWCKNESERESNSILMTLQKVMEDVKRRSKMSAVAEAALIDAHDKLSTIVSESKDIAIDELLGELRALKSDNAEVNRLVNPVIEALQFQDKLVQNLQNLEKMILAWFTFELKMRETKTTGQINNEGPIREELLKSLLKAATTSEERKTVRKYFSVESTDNKLNKTA